MVKASHTNLSLLWITPFRNC